VAAASEARLQSVLETALKAPWVIYRNVAWLEKRPDDEPGDGEADIVIAHPDLGVMVIEVRAVACGGSVRDDGNRSTAMGTGTTSRIRSRR
jgi:hypothetical protein